LYFVCVPGVLVLEPTLIVGDVTGIKCRQQDFPGRSGLKILSPGKKFGLFDNATLVYYYLIGPFRKILPSWHHCWYLNLRRTKFESSGAECSTNLRWFLLLYLLRILILTKLS
jgi:hypothetical protein